MSPVINRYFTKPKIYMVVGVPCSGKSWVCEQLTEEFEYIPHDYVGHYNEKDAYLLDILDLADKSDKDILIETPFSMNEYQKPLEEQSYEVIPVFIIESPVVLSKRYKDREGKVYPKGNLTRNQTFMKRAMDSGLFKGTSEEVLIHLKEMVRED